MRTVKFIAQNQNVKKGVRKISDLTFKEDTHSYFLGDLPIPSVSEIIKPIYQKVYGKIDEDTLNVAAERGTRIHRAIEFLSKYNFCGIDSDIFGCIEAYKKFKNEHKDWNLIQSEYQTYHKFLLYGMTLDQLYKTPQGLIICDIKTTKIAHPNAWSVQLSGYKAGFESWDKKVFKILALQLLENGNYILHELKDNFEIFLSCLKIHKNLHP